MRTITTAAAFRQMDAENTQLRQQLDNLRRQNAALLDALIGAPGTDHTEVLTAATDRLRELVGAALDELEAERAERDALRAEKWGVA